MFPICVHTLCTEIRIKMLVEWYEEKKMECYMVSFIIRSLCNWARVPASMLRVLYIYVFAMLCFRFFSHFTSILRLRLCWLPAKNHWKCALTNGIPFLYLQFAILTYTIFWIAIISKIYWYLTETCPETNKVFASAHKM